MCLSSRSHPRYNVFVFFYGTEQARKDVAQIFNHLLRRQIGSRLPTVEYLSSKPDVVLSALKGYVRPAPIYIPFPSTWKKSRDLLSVKRD